MIKKFEEFVNEIYNKSNNNWISINESQESKSQSAAIKLLMDRFGWEKQKADKFVREDLRNDITSLRDKDIAKFTLGVTRMYCDGELKDANIISNLNATLKLLFAHLNEYDRNLNGLIADELIHKFEKIRQNNISKQKQEIARMKFNVSDYEIVKIDSFSDAKKYYKYTNPGSRWCLTHMENMFNSYTCDGLNQIYFCLKNGFEDIKPIVGENAPLDDYGLSMLSIIVNEEGELSYCTCRWNHDNGGSDSVMDAVEISKVVNVDFYETFKPNTKWKDMVNDAQSRLKDGESPRNIFDYVFNFKDGYICVKLQNRFNLIDQRGKFVFNKWFKNISRTAKKHFYLVRDLDGGENFINIFGEGLFNVCVKRISNIPNYPNNYYKVTTTDNKYNIFDINKNIFKFDQWFDDLDDIKDNIFAVKLKKKWNAINFNGDYIFDKWVTSRKKLLENLN